MAAIQSSTPLQTTNPQALQPAAGSQPKCINKLAFEYYLEKSDHYLKYYLGTPAALLDEHKSESPKIAVALDKHRDLIEKAKKSKDNPELRTEYYKRMTKSYEDLTNYLSKYFDFTEVAPSSVKTGTRVVLSSSESVLGNFHCLSLSYAFAKKRNLSAMLDFFRSEKFDDKYQREKIQELNTLGVSDKEAALLKQFKTIYEKLEVIIAYEDEKNYSDLTKAIYHRNEPSSLPHMTLSSLRLITEVLKDDEHFGPMMGNVQKMFAEVKDVKLSRLERAKSRDVRRILAESVQDHEDLIFRIFTALKPFWDSMAGFCLLEDMAKSKKVSHERPIFPKDLPEKILKDAKKLLPLLEKNPELYQDLQKKIAELQLFEMEASANDTLSGKILYYLENLEGIARFNKDFVLFKKEFSKYLASKNSKETAKISAKKSQEKIKKTSKTTKASKPKKKATKPQPEILTSVVKEKSKSDMPLVEPVGAPELTLDRKQAVDTSKAKVTQVKAPVKSSKSIRNNFEVGKLRTFTLDTEIYSQVKLLTSLANDEDIYYLISTYMSQSSFPSCPDAFAYHFRKHANTNTTTLEQYLCNAIKAQESWNGYDVRLSLSKNDAHDRHSRERLAIVRTSSSFAGHLIFHSSFFSPEYGKTVTFSTENRKYPQSAVDELLQDL